jgi:hypothetical protein
MPNLARRLWLVSRMAHVRRSKDGKYTLENLGTYASDEVLETSDAEN